MKNIKIAKLLQDGCSVVEQIEFKKGWLKEKFKTTCILNGMGKGNISEIISPRKFKSLKRFLVVSSAEKIYENEKGEWIYKLTWKWCVNNEI